MTGWDVSAGLSCTLLVPIRAIPGVYAWFHARRTRTLRGAWHTRVNPRPMIFFAGVYPPTRIPNPQQVFAMTLFLFLKSLFAQPHFVSGERVNLVQGGSIARTDGYVVGQTDGGVLVEWPRGGASVVSANHLTLIG